MASKGRLYNKDSGEGGADANYDGAHKSAFEAAASTRPSPNMAQAAERFKVQEMAPDVDVHVAGIGAAAGNAKPSASWAQGKGRFEEPKQEVGAGDYNVAKSDFEKVSHKPSPNMMTPEKGKERSSNWMTNPDQVATPSASAPTPGAFDAALKKNSPSPFSQQGGQRFKDLHTVSSHGEPGSAAAPASDFAKAASNARPSPAAMAGGDRFKKAYDVPSYGDPGAQLSASDIERANLEAKIARQKAQAEADRDRALQ